MDAPAPWCPYPHLGEGPWECCRVKAEELPSNRFMQIRTQLVEELPGWTVQQGNAQAVPREICPECEAEFTQDEIHLHTREVHGYELVIEPHDRVPHRRQVPEQP